MRNTFVKRALTRGALVVLLAALIFILVSEYYAGTFASVPIVSAVAAPPLSRDVPIIVGSGDAYWAIYPDDIDLKRDPLTGKRTFSKERLENELELFARLSYVPPSDAVLNLHDLSIYPERRGVKVNVTASLPGVAKRLASGGSGEVIPVVLQEITPKVRGEDLIHFDSKPVGEYTTHFNPWQRGRVYNIKLAVSILNGTIAMPGETFSFNKTVGARNTLTGYRVAPVIVQKQLVDGIGGGVCQVSSTLYNAACARAGLWVVERHAHGLPIHYLPPGRDATVAWPALDLKFRNTYDAPIMIKGDVKGASLTFRIFSKKGAVRTQPSNFKIVIPHYDLPPKKPPAEAKPKSPDKTVAPGEAEDEGVVTPEDNPAQTSDEAQPSSGASLKEKAGKTSASAKHVGEGNAKSKPAARPKGKSESGSKHHPAKKEKKVYF